MEYIRRHYGVPAKRGAAIVFDGTPGTIVGSWQSYLRVRLEGYKRLCTIHPTWRVQYQKQATEGGR